MPADNDDTSHRVALMGFTSFEQQALESYILLARSRTPSYTPAATLDEAHFIVANGDRVGVIDELITAQRMQDTLLVGNHARQGAAAWLERPIDPLHLFRALDTAVKRQAIAATATRVTPRHVMHAELSEAWALDALPSDNGPMSLRAAAALLRATSPATLPSPALRTSPAALPERPQPLGITLPADRSVERMGERQGASANASAPQPQLATTLATPHGQLRAVPKRVPPGPGEPLLALVVGADDAGALHVAMALQAHGISSERALESRRAFVALQDQVFDLIVIDVDLGFKSDLDGLSLAQAMKRQVRPFGDPSAPIFLTSSRPTPLEHAQAMVAGADAYLSVPMSADALTTALERAELRISAGLSDASVAPRIA